MAKLVQNCCSAPQESVGYHNAKSFYGGVEPSINMPVYNPMYYGHHVLGDGSGAVFPQQQCVLNAAGSAINYGYVGQPPSYVRHMSGGMHSIPLSQESIASLKNGAGTGVETAQLEQEDNTVNVTRYIWKRNGEQSSCGAFWNPLGIHCCGGESVDKHEVEEQDNVQPNSAKSQEEVQQQDGGEQQDDDGDKQNQQDASAQETETVEKQKADKKQVTCNPFFSCCFNAPEEYVGFGRGSTNIFHLNTLFRGATLQGIPSIGSEAQGTNMVNNVPWYQCWEPRGAVAPVVQRVSTPQYDLPTSVPFFGNCWGHLPTFCGGNNFVTLPTQSSFGLRELYATPLPCSPIGTQRSFIPSVTSIPSVPSGIEPLEHQMRSMGLNPYTNTPQVYQARPNAKPVTFKLHAIEIHQYVPMPNMKSTKFIDSVIQKNLSDSNGPHIYQHGYGESNPQCFFNPNVTGLMAPMMGHIIHGQSHHHVPEMYNMTNGENGKVVRLQTQESQLNAGEASGDAQPQN